MRVLVSVWWGFWTLFSVSSAFIGIAGMPDDLATWSQWIEPMIKDPRVIALAERAVFVAEFINQPWVRISLVAIGAFFLFWLLKKARGLLQRKEDKEEKATQVAAIDPNWRETYLNRPTLKIYEAACLFAGVPPQRPVPLGAASSYVEEFQEAVRHKWIDALDPRPTDITTLTKPDSIREMDRHKYIVDNLSDETAVITSSVFAYVKKRLPQEVLV